MFANEGSRLFVVAVNVTQQIKPRYQIAWLGTRTTYTPRTPTTQLPYDYYTKHAWNSYPGAVVLRVLLEACYFHQRMTL